VLIDPEPAALRAALRRRPADWAARVELLGRPLDFWRDGLRSALGLYAPVVATGHQCEFFHAGVFAKIIVADVLAEDAHGTAVFLGVDCDVFKVTSLAVPQITVRGLRRVEVPIPGCRLNEPVELQGAVPREEFLDFFSQVGGLYEHYEISLLGPFAAAFLDDEPALELCEGLARGYRSLQENLGLKPARQVRVSALCASGAFRAFAAELILRAGHCATCYNAARSVLKVSGNRLVPALEVSGDLVEIPLWVFRAGGPRRRLSVRIRDQNAELLADEEPIDAIRRSVLEDPAQAVRPWKLEQDGWRLRPRAVTLSSFARLFLSDLFIHGIGGAVYDQVTDEFLQRFFGVGLPAAACVTATAHLPLPCSNVSDAELFLARRAARDVFYNPQRYLSQPSAALLSRRQELIRRSDELRKKQPEARALRREVFEQIRQVNAELLAAEPHLPARLEQRLRDLEYRRQLDNVARDRTYFVALHTRATLTQLVDLLRDRLQGR
jgi:hypothetical protein